MNTQTAEPIKFYIIITTYNTENYLRECINSILTNTYSNFEIILADDGSTDNSLQICTEFAKADNRISVFSQPNQGVASIRNNALAFALKKVNSENSAIHMIDGDDYVSRDFYKYAAKSMYENRADVVTTTFYNEHTNYLDSEPNLLLLGLLGRLSGNLGLMKGAWAYLIHTSFLKKNPNLRFRSDIPIGEDTIFINEMLILASRVVIESNSIYYYRYNISSCTKKEKSLKELKKIREIQHHVGFLLEEQAKQYNVPPKIWGTFMARNFEKQTRFCKDLITDEIINKKNEETLQNVNASYIDSYIYIPKQSKKNNFYLNFFLMFHTPIQF